MKNCEDIVQKLQNLKLFDFLQFWHFGLNGSDQSINTRAPRYFFYIRRIENSFEIKSGLLRKFLPPSVLT